MQRGQLFYNLFLVQSLVTIKLSQLKCQFELWNGKWDFVFVLTNFWIRIPIFGSFLRSSAERSDGDLSSVDKRVSFNNDVKIKCIPKKSNNNKSSSASGTESLIPLKEGNKIWVMRYWHQWPCEIQNYWWLPPTFDPPNYLVEYKGTSICCDADKVGYMHSLSIRNVLIRNNPSNSSIIRNHDPLNFQS